MPHSYEVKTTLSPLGTERYATLTLGLAYIEIPITAAMSNNDIQTAISEFVEEIPLAKPAKFEVYVEGVVVHHDVFVSSSAGVSLVARLQAAFPDHSDWSRFSYNVVAEYDAYREPYQNSSISWYNMNEKPSSELLSSFAANYDNGNIRPWYGLKFDMTTNTAMLKVVLESIDFPKPDLPASTPASTFYSVTHNLDGTTSPWIDAYVYTTVDTIRAFCETHGLTFPYPADFDLDTRPPTLWGFVFNKDTLAYGKLKGYRFEA